MLKNKKNMTNAPIKSVNDCQEIKLLGSIGNTPKKNATRSPMVGSNVYVEDSIYKHTREAFEGTDTNKAL